MIVYIINGEGFAPSARLSLLFSPSRQEKLARLHTPAVRAQSACAEMAYMLCLKRALGFVPPYRLGFNDKPEMTDRAHGCFSLSHAGPYGMCAWSESPVGADIESASRDLSRMARRVRAENDELPSLNLLWCVKESYVKLTGEGLSHPFPALTVREDAIYGTSPVPLAYYQTGQIEDFLWCVCAEKKEPLSLTILSAAEAEDQLLL